MSASKAAPVAAFVLLAFLLLLALWPGLGGGFLFDDYANLPALAAFGPLGTGEALLLYLTSGIADPLGRPLALASFLPEAAAWPDAPSRFIATNLGLHLLNAALVALLARRVLALAGERQAGWLALLAAFLWALHPMQGSTALYIVQRHALLAAGFSLLGLLAFLRFWQAPPRQRPLWAATYLLAGLAAVLSKLNGLLLPVLACALLPLLHRATAPAAPGHAAPPRVWIWALAGLPALGLLALLLAQIPQAAAGAAQLRDFSLGERLLAQPGVLLGYLRDLLTLAPTSGDLMFNPPALPQGFADPAFWGPAAALLALAAFAAWCWRSFPLLGTALLFYAAGHLIESGPVNLELAFAHRNYLPATLLFLPVAAALARLPITTGLRAGASAALLAAAALVLHGEARLWGQPRLLAEVWAARAPLSERAQVHAATWDVWQGDIGRGLQRLAPWRGQAARSTQVALTLLDLECATGTVSPALAGQVADAIASDRRGLTLTVSLLAQHSQRYAACAATAPTAATMLAAAEANPHWRPSAGRVDLAFARLAVLAEAGDPAGALQALLDPDLPPPPCGTVLRAAALLGEAGARAEALSLLAQRGPTCHAAPVPFGMPRLHRWLRHKLGTDQRELDALAEALSR